jgi:hypothetical protein
MVLGALAAVGAPACTGQFSEPGGGTETSALCDPLPAVPARLWRLSVSQYSNSVRDLLGLQAGPSLASTGGTSLYAFFSDDTLTVDPQLAYQINVAVRDLLASPSVDIAGLAACMPGEADDACAGRFAKSFGLRAYRRPVDDDEVAALMNVYATGAMTDFNSGIGLMIQAMLQSPSFMFRTELGSGSGSTSTLTPYEVASQLSYTFLDSTPDQPLLDAAASGDLAKPSGISAQVDRLLGLDAVKQNISSIVVDWFNVQQLYAKTKDPSLLTALSMADQDQTQLQGDLYTSARAFVDDLLWSGSGKINDLLTSQRIFVNQRLATLYGLPYSGTGDDFVPVDTTAGDRAGLLTQPAVLWAASDPAVTSIVKRGKFIHDDIICGNPLPPPSALLNDPNIQMILAELMTERAKSDYRLSNDQCSQCHTNIDPYGRILEGFDPIGRSRTIADGLPADPTGDFSQAPPLTGTITGAVAFAQAIIADKQLGQCAAQMISSYALGRMVRDDNTCEVQTIQRNVDKADGKVVTLFRQVATANFMRTRGGGQ